MIRYQAISTVTLHTGLVQLEPEQARRRGAKLKPVGDDVYEIQAPTQFKRGERFGYDGALPKALAGEILEVKPDYCAPEADRNPDSGAGAEVSAPAVKTKSRRKG